MSCIASYGSPRSTNTTIPRAEARGHSDNHRADGRRQTGRQIKTGRSHVLRRLDWLRAHLALSGRKRRPRCASWRGQIARGHHCWWVPQRSDGRRDAVQHDPGNTPSWRATGSSSEQIGGDAWRVLRPSVGQSTRQSGNSTPVCYAIAVKERNGHFRPVTDLASHRGR